MPKTSAQLYDNLYNDLINKGFTPAEATRFRSYITPTLDGTNNTTSPISVDTSGNALIELTNNKSVSGLLGTTLDARPDRPGMMFYDRATPADVFNPGKMMYIGGYRYGFAIETADLSYFNLYQGTLENIGDQFEFHLGFPNVSLAACGGAKRFASFEVRKMTLDGGADADGILIGWDNNSDSKGGPKNKFVDDIRTACVSVQNNVDSLKLTTYDGDGTSNYLNSGGLEVNNSLGYRYTRTGMVIRHNGIIDFGGAAHSAQCVDVDNDAANAFYGKSTVLRIMPGHHRSGLTSEVDFGTWSQLSENASAGTGFTKKFSILHNPAVEGLLFRDLNDTMLMQMTANGIFMGVPFYFAGDSTVLSNMPNRDLNGTDSGSNLNWGYAGAIKLRNINTTQRDALTPSEGMIVYNSQTHKLQVHNGSTWADCN